jgi:hypothetical protein
MRNKKAENNFSKYIPLAQDDYIEIMMHADIALKEKEAYFYNQFNKHHSVDLLAADVIDYIEVDILHNDSSYAKFIDNGQLKKFLLSEMKRQGIDESKFDDFVSEKLAPYDDINEFIVQQGAVNDVVKDVVEEIKQTFKNVEGGIRVKKRLITADSKSPKYMDAAKGDYLQLTKNLVSFMDIHEDKYTDLYRQTHDPSVLEEELSSEVNEEIQLGLESVFSDYIFGGKLSDVLMAEMEEKGMDPDDDNEFFKYSEEVLSPWDGVHDYIAENGSTKESDHNIHEAVEEFIEEHF